MSSFADELKELALTAPKEKDSEDVFNEESNAKLADYDDIYEEVETKKSAEVLSEGRYKGKKISRREMFDDEDEDHFLKLNPNLYEVVDEDDDDEEEIDDDDEDDDEVEADGSGEGENRGALDGKFGEELDSTEDFGDEESEDVDYVDEDDGEGSDEASAEDGDDDEDMADGDECDISTFAGKNEKFKQLEDSVATKALNGLVSEEIRKGRCISQQMKVWDKLLEYRIQFQKVLALANQLPPADVFRPTMKAFLSNSENARVYKQCVRNVERAFEQLAALRADMVRKYPEMKKCFDGKSSPDSGDEESAIRGDDDDDEIPSDIASGYSEDDDDDDNDGQPKRKKSKLAKNDRNGTCQPDVESNGEVTKRKNFSLNETLQADEEFRGKLLPFRNATIDKWYQRTKLASGKTSKGYTALEQPPVKQIEHILEDQERLLERTRVKRSQYKIIGYDEHEKNEAAEAGKQIISEIFDDDDFYHHLLREVIERKTQDISDPFEVSRHWIEIQKLRTKIKRKIDTKASKGRRVRYDVIPKLVSFMTPHDGSTFSDQAKDELFSSIFGKRSQKPAKPELKSQLTKSDLEGFRLFK